MKKPFVWLKARFLSKKRNLVHPTNSNSSVFENEDDCSLVHPSNIDRDSDSDYLDRNLDKLKKSDGASSRDSRQAEGYQGYVSFMNSLSQTQGFKLPMPTMRELQELMEDPPTRPPLLKKLDNESWEFVSELLEARKELKQQGYPTDGSRRREIRSKKIPLKSTHYWPRSQIRKNALKQLKYV